MDYVGRKKFQSMRAYQDPCHNIARQGRELYLLGHFTQSKAAQQQDAQGKERIFILN